MFSILEIILSEGIISLGAAWSRNSGKSSNTLWWPGSSLSIVALLSTVVWEFAKVYKAPSHEKPLGLQKQLCGFIDSPLSFHKKSEKLSQHPSSLTLNIPSEPFSLTASLPYTNEGSSPWVSLLQPPNNDLFNTPVESSSTQQ